MLVYRRSFAIQRKKKTALLLIGDACGSQPNQLSALFFARWNCRKSLHDGPFATPLATVKPQCHELDLFLEKLML